MDNSFDQLCINYINERFQQYFIELMLKREKQWYDREGLDVPFVPFFDNSHIIGMKSYSTFIFCFHILDISSHNV